jgi:hypothetical protein
LWLGDDVYLVAVGEVDRRLQDDLVAILDTLVDLDLVGDRDLAKMRNPILRVITLMWRNAIPVGRRFRPANALHGPGLASDYIPTRTILAKADPALPDRTGCRSQD